MMADQDRVTTITVVEAGVDAQAIQGKVAAVCGDRAVEVVVLTNEPNMTIRQRIKNYLREQSENDNYIDFCCVGNRGINVGSAASGENYLGTVA